MALHDVTGWRCEVCGARVPIDEPRPWRCPAATAGDRRHVLWAESSRLANAPSDLDDPNPFIRYDQRLAWAAMAAARGMTAAARHALVRELDAAVAAVEGHGFEATPFERSSHLSDALGFDARGGVWVKDETGAVGGSQKARHLCSILLALRADEVLCQADPADRAPLAIASCGNAALAAATLARAAAWPIDVFVPTWMGEAFGRRLDELGARIVWCERRPDDPPGDPAMLRFREAVATGSVPFTVQGPENALCLDGGRTIGWEVADQATAAGVAPAASFVQVGGGAFAGSLGRGVREKGLSGSLLVVQTEGCAPFDRAMAGVAGDDAPARRWAEVMTPWSDPASLADGLLDDETYDWLSVLHEVRASAGDSVVVAERLVVEAHELASAAGYRVSPTGSAGLAGLLAAGGAARFGASSQVVVVMSGLAR